MLEFINSSLYKLYKEMNRFGFNLLFFSLLNFIFGNERVV
jgi:hypothetical protein